MIGGFQPGAFQPNFQQVSGTELVGRRPRRHKTRFQPWGPEYDFEWLNIQTNIEALQAEAGSLRDDISKARQARDVTVRGIGLLQDLHLRRKQLDGELSRLRMRRLRRERFLRTYKKLQEEEDELVLTLLANYLN